MASAVSIRILLLKAWSICVLTECWISALKRLLKIISAPALTVLPKSCRRWVFLLYSPIVAHRFLKLSVSAAPLLKNISQELRRVLKASDWTRLPERLLCVMSLRLLSKTLIFSAMNQVRIINGVMAVSSICLIRKRLSSYSRPARPVIISSLRSLASSCAAVLLPIRICAVC